MIIKRGKYQAYKYLLLYLILFEAGTPVQTVYPREFILSIFFIAVIMLLYKKKISYKSGVILEFTGVTMMLTYLVNMDTHFSTAIMILLVMFSAVAFSGFYTRLEFEDIYVGLMTFLAVVSVVFYVIGRLFPAFVRILPVFQGVNGAYPIVMGVFFYPCESNRYLSTLTRNTGIFREMGLFALLLIWALCIMFQKKNEGKYTCKSQLIIIAALITTFSTTGIFAFVMLLPVFIKRLKVIGKRMGRLRYIIYAFSIAAFWGILYKNRLLLFGKLNPQNIDYGSFKIRYEGLIQDITMFICDPWGAGPTRYMSESVGSANSVSYFLACFGLGTTFIVFFGFFFFFISLDYSRKNKIFVLGAATLVLMTQGVYDYIIFYIFVIYGYLGYKKILSKKNGYETKKSCNDQLLVQRI